MQMEYIDGGSLKEHIVGSKWSMAEKEIRSIMVELMGALKYCHQKKIVHRDIKLENIMLRQRGDLSKGLVLIDFGIAGRDHESHQGGTVRYAPPELLTGASFQVDPSFDVWSLGILLYRLAINIFPFTGETFQDIKSSIINDQLAFPSHCKMSSSCTSLIAQMLNKDPIMRPTLNEILQHQWFLKSTPTPVKYQTPLRNELAATQIKFFSDTQPTKDYLRPQASPFRVTFVKKDRSLKKVKVPNKDLDEFIPKGYRPGNLNKDRDEYPQEQQWKHVPSIVVQAGDYIPMRDFSTLTVKKKRLSNLRNFIKDRAFPSNMDKIQFEVAKNPLICKVTPKQLAPLNSGLKITKVFLEDEVKMEIHSFSKPSRVIRLKKSSVDFALKINTTSKEEINTEKTLDYQQNSPIKINIRKKSISALEQQPTSRIPSAELTSLITQPMNDIQVYVKTPSKRKTSSGSSLSTLRTSYQHILPVNPTPPHFLVQGRTPPPIQSPPISTKSTMKEILATNPALNSTAMNGFKLQLIQIQNAKNLLKIKSRKYTNQKSNV